MIMNDCSCLGMALKRSNGWGWGWAMLSEQQSCGASHVLKSDCDHKSGLMKG